MKESDTLTQISSELSVIENNGALRDARHFKERAEALDFLELHVITRLAFQIHPFIHSTERSALLVRIKKILKRFEQADRLLWRNLRIKIAGNKCSPASFREIITVYTGISFPIGHQSEPGYDVADQFINGLFADEPVPAPTMPLPEGMVDFQKTPARILFELAESVMPGPDDVFVDLGSGLGQTAILFHLLTGGRSAGIDIEPAYTRYARSCLAGMNLSAVSFITDDICNGRFGDGTIFFMYTPGRAAATERVLNKLYDQSLRRPIQLFTYGPCSLQAAHEKWLSRKPGIASNPKELFHFYSC